MNEPYNRTVTIVQSESIRSITTIYKNEPFKVIVTDYESESGERDRTKFDE